MFKTLANVQDFLPLIIIGGLLAFFGLIVIIVIILKRKVSFLQIKKEDIDEETAIKQELDRVLVPIEDENIQKEMEATEIKETSNPSIDEK